MAALWLVTSSLVTCRTAKYIDNQLFKMPAFQMPTASTKRKIDAPEEDSFSRKRISLNSNSRSLADSANSDSGVSCIQKEQVWMVQWYNLIGL